MYKLEQNGEITYHTSMVDALNHASKNGSYNDGIMCGYLGHTITEC